jgi:GntR family transcriptional regulator
MKATRPTDIGLNSQSPIPLYRQLADILLDKIHLGEYPPGTRIPSEHMLARRYGIGRPTARQATEALIRKGELIRKRGAGTFVCETSREVDIFSLGGTLAAFERKGVTVGTEVLRAIEMIDVSGIPENPFDGREAYFFSRLNSVNGEPVLIEDIFLHSVLFAGIDRIDLSGKSVSQVVEERYYLRPTGGKQLFRVEYPNRERGKRLKITVKKPVLAVRRFLNFSGCDNAIYSELYCRTDQFVFSQVIGG